MLHVFYINQVKLITQKPKATDNLGQRSSPQIWNISMQFVSPTAVAIPHRRDAYICLLHVLWIGRHGIQYLLSTCGPDWPAHKATNNWAKRVQA